jgi:sulfate adenylyltransferase
MEGKTKQIFFFFGETWVMCSQSTNQNPLFSVVEKMRLANGLLWTIPITLDVSKEQIEESKIEATKRIALLDPRDYTALAILTVEDVYRPDKKKEAELVYGADDEAHPAVHYLHHIAKEFNVGGTLEAVQSPSHYDYVANRCKNYIITV